MKVLLIGNYDKDHQFSMQKFCACLYQELLRLGVDVSVCKPKPILGYWSDSTTNGLSKWLGYIDKYFVFPLMLIRLSKSADLIHICDHSNAMYTKYFDHGRYLITCHDMMATRSAFGEFHHNKNISKTGQLQQKWILKV